MLPPTPPPFLEQSSSYSAAITRLSSETLSLKRSLNRLEFAENELSFHLASVKHQQRLIQK